MQNKYIVQETIGLIAVRPNTSVNVHHLLMPGNYQAKEALLGTKIKKVLDIKF